MRYRLKVEIEYLIAIGNEKSVKNLSSLPKNEQTRLRKIYHNFNTACAEKVKEIEATTNHDVKAIEYYIQGKLKKALHPWKHSYISVRVFSILYLLFQVLADKPASIRPAT